MARPLLGGSLKKRQAVAYAVDRKDYINQRGLYGGAAWSHMLPPNMRGSSHSQPYPLHRNLAKAKSLGAGGGDDLNYFYQSAGSVGPKQYQVARRDLSDLGYNVQGKGFAGFDIYQAAGTRGSSHDIVGQVGWCQDYPDPYDFINVLLDGTKIQAEENVNIVVLQLQEVQHADAEGRPPHRGEAVRDVRQARHQHLEERRSMGLDGRLDEPVLLLEQGCAVDDGLPERLPVPVAQRPRFQVRGRAREQGSIETRRRLRPAPRCFSYRSLR